MTIRLKRRRAGWRRWLIASVAGCAVLGVAPSLLPGTLWPPDPVAAPAPGPAALAQDAVAAGAPAALPGLAVLIAEREAQVRAHPRDARSWAVLGAAYVEQGRRTADPARFPKAEEALRTALRLEKSPAALEGLAALAVARRDFPGAKRWGEAARRLAPERWTTQAVLIDAYTGLGDHKAVGRALERLVKLRPGAAAVRARKAAVYRDRGWREDAVAQITDAVAVARTPAERAAYLEQAGRLAFERGEREEALRYFREALRTDPGQRAAQAGQGRALAALGRTSEALTAYQAALDRQPRPEDALELGELYESLGLGRAARVQYDLLRERVRAAAAGGADEELVLGRFEAAHGDAAAAVRRLGAEWRRQPSTAVADALGWALYRDGRAGEALEYAVRATDGERGGGVRSAAYVYHRGVIEREVGRYGAARRHLQEALRINPWFSPLDGPRAREVLAELGEPSVESPPSG
ncbi:tetratricopeptide repeat protein [Streptomyces sp. ISL-12]|uniref:tetratricopeptide repeat protein n=1 Tax=Streptomyces sp. ISL-12 TaxID=2819177 RepID=UPI001BE56A95|nr:tetratricopeptide repeat protein [Streptomyces sp. ISL-12]MBT2409993.1 tetratricopeptide repeat protein [Streptomyces sp. ISL-12]